MKIELLKETSKEVVDQITKLVEQLAPNSPAVTTKHVEEVISCSTTLVMVARDEQNKIVGMATLVVILKLQGGKKAMIEDVVVDETMRGRGVGKLLMQKVLETAKELEVKTVFLTSRSSRMAANKMYQSLGFVQYETNNYKYDLGN